MRSVTLIVLFSFVGKAQKQPMGQQYSSYKLLSSGNFMKALVGGPVLDSLLHVPNPERNPSVNAERNPSVSAQRDASVKAGRDPFVNAMRDPSVNAMGDDLVRRWALNAKATTSSRREPSGLWNAAWNIYVKKFWFPRDTSYSAFHKSLLPRQRSPRLISSLATSDSSGSEVVKENLLGQLMNFKGTLYKIDGDACYQGEIDQKRKWVALAMEGYAPGTCESQGFTQPSGLNFIRKGVVTVSKFLKVAKQNARSARTPSFKLRKNQNAEAEPHWRKEEVAAQITKKKKFEEAKAKANSMAAEEAEAAQDLVVVFQEANEAAAKAKAAATPALAPTR